MLQYLSNFYTKFKHDQCGAITVFIVGIFTTMILVGGAAIDLVRVEAVRSTIQYNLDRAVLAAASMRQIRNPADVVTDYMSKVETLSSFSVVIDNANTHVTLTGREVSAVATATISTYFLRIAGIDEWNVTAASRAAEEIPNLEISLVLDVSGSMGGSKISSLRTAAKIFVDTVIIAGDDSKTSVSIIPYSTNVSVPQSMWDQYTIDQVAGQTRCIIFEDSDYGVAAISTTATQRQLSYYAYTGTFYGAAGTYSGKNYYECEKNAYAEILPFSTSVIALQSKIDTLQASGSTATHIGTKWGLALLDPAASPIATTIGGEVATLPEAYNEPGVLKVLVVMTDGQNQIHYKMGDSYRKGPSDMYEVFSEKPACDQSWKVWYFVTDGSYASSCSYEVAGGDFYIKRPSNTAFYQVVGSVDYYYYGNYTGPTLPGDPVAIIGEDGYQRRLDWPEVWKTISTAAYSFTIRGNGSGYRYGHSSIADADTQTLAACSTAKSNGVVVYTIAFQAPSSAQTLLQNCASSPSTYYDVSTTNIADAFASIAVSVQKLKLTQ